MSYEANIRRHPALQAGADLSAAANQYRAVGLDASGNVVIAVSGGLAIGILYNKPAANAEAEVVTEGTPKVKLGGTVNEGDILIADASGDLVASAPAVGNTNQPVGIAMRAGSSGEIIPCMLARPALNTAAT